jgi:fructokinase
MGTSGHPEVVCVGEALVDFLPEQRGLAVHQVERWVRCSGGSPANVAVGVARLGGRSAMVGAVGQDDFGTFLRESLAREGVDVSRLRPTADGKTGLVFISLSETGERSFSFYRTRAAELFLGERDVDEAYLGSARAVHFGTNSLLFREAQRAVVRMVRSARAADRIVSCDPNLRLHLWTDPAELKALIGLILPSATVVKLSEDELSFVTGTADPADALLALRRAGVPLPIVTLGDRGATFLWQDRQVSVSSPSAVCVDATGAGDGFMAGLLFGLARLYPDASSLQRATVGELRELVSFACTVGARVVGKIGAVGGLPMRAEVEGALPGFLREASAREP